MHFNNASFLFLRKFVYSIYLLYFCNKKTNFMEKISVIRFVKEKFSGKVDKGGHAYFKHCDRVAKSAFKLLLDDDKALKVWYIGMLHDILEDTDTTIDELKSIDGVTDEIIESVKTLTRNYYGDETYFEYIERVSKDDFACIVKICDLKDNMDITRLPELTDEHFSLLKRYHKAYGILTGKFIIYNN